ncbi:MAG: signal peptidase I [Gemmatimonadetes bacterium]|nr:signal peptidase I [Gemmatimonadota bacterium]
MTERNYPGFLVRIASALVDSLVCTLGSAALLLLVLHLDAGMSTEALLRLFLFVWIPGSVAASLGGLAFLNAGGRTSPGKILFGLAVVDRLFRPVSFRRSLLRTLVHSLLLGSSFLLIPFTRGRRGLHDLIGGTFVTRTRPPLRCERLIALAALALTVWIDAAVAGELNRYLQSFRISSGSMEPALLKGDNITTDTRWARTFEPRRGDIVVYEHPRNPGKKVVKRIMGLPGERISLRDTVLYIDGKPLPGDPGVYRGPRHAGMGIPEPFRVPQDHYFLLGDNRDNSSDSRIHGPVRRALLHAKAGIVYLSVEDGFYVRWNRFGHLVR